MRFTSDPDNLVAFVQAQAPLVASRDHGDDHWRGVCAAGLEICEAGAEVDPQLMWLFALLHDGRRYNDWDDPEHGKRACELLRELRKDGRIVMADDEVDLLEEALLEHDMGLTSDDPFIGACWDADRLQLQRFGYTLDPARLSTDLGHLPSMQQTCKEHAFDPPSWPNLTQWAQRL